jgi:hypothetical protein
MVVLHDCGSCSSIRQASRMTGTNLFVGLLCGAWVISALEECLFLCTVVIGDVATLRTDTDRSLHGASSCINRLQHLNIITEFNLIMLVPTDPIAATYFSVFKDVSELKKMVIKEPVQ